MTAEQTAKLVAPSGTGKVMMPHWSPIVSLFVFFYIILLSLHSCLLRYQGDHYLREKVFGTEKKCEVCSRKH